MQNDYSNVISQNAKSVSQKLSEFFVDNRFLESGEHNFQPIICIQWETNR